MVSSIEERLALRLGDLCHGVGIRAVSDTAFFDMRTLAVTTGYKLELLTDDPVGLAEQLAGIGIEKVIQNGPATVALFDDGTKQVAKAHDGDGFDPRFGTLWCALRKAARNRAIGHLEKAVRKVAQQAKGPDDYEALGNALLMVAQHMKKEE